MKLLFAGDWHGDEDWASEAIGRAADTGAAWVVQLGDFGFGFYRLGDDPAQPGDWAPRCPFARRVSALAVELGVQVVFIDGNHDNPVLLARLAHSRDPAGAEAFVPVEDGLFWAPRGHRWEWDGIRFGALGGAYSIDRRMRTTGLDFWPEEVTAPADVARLGHDPLDVLVCHDGPTIPEGFRPLPGASPRKVDQASRDQVATAVERTRPRLVVHGHWHLRYTAERPDGGRAGAAGGSGRAAPATRVEGLASNLEHDDRALLALDLSGFDRS